MREPPPPRASHWATPINAQGSDCPPKSNGSSQPEQARHPPLDQQRRWKSPQRQHQWTVAPSAGHQTTVVHSVITWYCARNIVDSSKEIGQNPPTETDLYDMHGNVWEWCHDGYSTVYPINSTTNYVQVSPGNGRVLRGGSWQDEPQDLAHRQSPLSTTPLPNADCGVEDRSGELAPRQVEWRSCFPPVDGVYERLVSVFNRRLKTLNFAITAHHPFATPTRKALFENPMES